MRGVHGRRGWSQRVWLHVANRSPGSRPEDLTVNSLTRGPGVQGLHPIQRAFVEKGGFQCGICTRGFIMSTFALLNANPKPTDAEIAEGLAGNVCRCGEYVKIYTSVRNASAEMAGGQVTHTAPASVFIVQAVQAAPSTAAAAQTTSKEFQFVTALST